MTDVSTCDCRFEIERLKRELATAEAFHKVAVRERDYERATVDRLRAAIAVAEKVLASV